MVIQRGAGVGARAARGGAKLSAEQREPPRALASPARRKLSFKDKHALDTLPATMERLQANIADLQRAFDDPTLYARDPARFSAVSDALAGAHAKLAEAEEEWLRLEMMREDIEG
jgi:ABC transport system ATP-binding/permease protein